MSRSLYADIKGSPRLIFKGKKAQGTEQYVQYAILCVLKKVYTCVYVFAYKLMLLEGSTRNW